MNRNACALNIQLDRLQQQIGLSESLFDAADTSNHQVHQLQNVINSVSITSKTQPLLSASRLVEILSHPTLSYDRSGSAEIITQSNESDYLWLVAAKATVQVSGLVMHALLEQTLQIEDEISYWDEVLTSGVFTNLYAAQTSPRRLWHWSKDIYSEVSFECASSTPISRSIAASWARFYQVARRNLRGISENPSVWHWSSPTRLCRTEIRQKRDRLVALRDLHTSSLGLLMEGWHVFRSVETVTELDTSTQEWQATVSKTIYLTEAILQSVLHDASTTSFEQAIFQAIEIQQSKVDGNPSTTTQHPRELARRLVHVLRNQLPDHARSVSSVISDQGRPSTIVRCWIPCSIALLSGSLSLNILLQHRIELFRWIMNIGSTIIDFGSNWVIEPIHKLIGTIRHDDKSEIAIMSKNSLMADRASLERMVVDFVRDRPDLSRDNPSADDSTAIVNAVKEGDLTPVLKAYERDLRAPFLGTVRGDLVRALLIQIQKTKVDVEIAISGINALLKSQELVFGYASQTRSCLVSRGALLC